jgi:hypothetical protein
MVRSPHTPEPLQGKQGRVIIFMEVEPPQPPSVSFSLSPASSNEYFISLLIFYSFYNSILSSHRSRSTGDSHAHSPPEWFGHTLDETAGLAEWRPLETHSTPIERSSDEVNPEVVADISAKLFAGLAARRRPTSHEGAA